MLGRSGTMRLRVVSLLCSCFALGAVWACSLNPQPLPPDGYDGSADAGVGSMPDASSADAYLDLDGTIPPTDASTDAGEAGDASDASDAADDARDDDAALDAGDDE
jgi:hypothetical protein